MKNHHHELIGSLLAAVWMGSLFGDRIEPFERRFRQSRRRPLTRCSFSPRRLVFATHLFPKSIKAIHNVGAVNNFTITSTEDATASSGQFQLGTVPRRVVFMSTTGDVLNDTQQAAFEAHTISA